MPTPTTSVRHLLAQVHAVAAAATSQGHQGALGDQLGFAAQLDARFATHEATLAPAQDCDVLHQAFGVKQLLQSQLFVLAGYLGPLPDHLARATLGEEVPAMRALLLLMHHRMVASWAQGALAIRPHTSFRKDTRDRWTLRIKALGACFEDLEAQHQDVVDWRTRAMGRTSAPRLLASIDAYFRKAQCLNLALALEPLTGSWVPLGQEDLCRLGRRHLGHDTVLGTRMRSLGSAWTLVVGPVDALAWKRLTQDIALRRGLCACIDALTSPSQSWTVVLTLQADAIAPLRLGTRDAHPHALGCGTYLGRAHPRSRVVWAVSSRKYAHVAA